MECVRFVLCYDNLGTRGSAVFRVIEIIGTPCRHGDAPAKSTVLIDCHVTTSKLNPTFTEIPGLFCVFGPVCEPSSPGPTVPMPQAQTSHSALAAIHESSISAKTARDRKAATCAESSRQRRTRSEISVDGPKGLRVRTCRRAETKSPRQTR